ncbi:MAG TPA: hypothetical protein PKC87_00265 [Candidatus Absconditabacterales bacterium]|nr:hypothetical protein [Candidatus Absconditabacterales bacterium]
MSYILFENKGEIDINSLKFMGCSTKDGVNTIGKFGTGLKYAISVLLRNGIKIEIFSGKNKVEFTTQKKEIGGKEFDVIFMNGEETGLTTNLGVEWKIWQGIREFYANCIDEKGSKINWLYKRQGKVGTTRIFIKNTNSVKNTFSYFQFDKWNEVSSGLYYLKKAKESPVKIFKEGFLVYEGTEKETSIYDYRIDFVSINEARLIENRWETFYYVGKIISLMDFYNVNRVLENNDYLLVSSFDNLGEGWNQAQQSRGGELITNSQELNTKLKELRAKKDDKFKYFGGYYGQTISLITIDEIGDFNINGESFKMFSCAFDKKENKKFDFDLNKHEIYINVKNLNEQKKIVLIIQELVENIREDKSKFIIKLLERIYNNI